MILLIIILLSLPFIGIWMLQSGTKSISKSLNEIKKQNENHTSKEIMTANIITLLVFILIIWWVIS